MLARIGQWFLGVWMTAVIAGAFLYAPPAKGLGETTRILYFHVPCAWIATLAFFVSAFYSLRYLQKQHLELDVRASVAAELGLLFAFLATVTGSIWAKKIWGAYWNWDPRETSIFILLMIYAAYFALRAAVEDGEQRARLAAVYSLIAAVTVPFFVFVVPRIYDSLHPDPLVNREAKIHMDPRMLTVFLSSLAGFTGLFFWIFHLRSTLKMIWEQKMQGVELTGDRT